MTAAKRIFGILSGLVMLLFSIVMMLFPEEAYVFVILFLDIALLLYGLRMLVYYFTMARFMVGGIATFYKSIIAIDFGLFVFGLEQIPQKFAMLYLIALLAFSAVVDILRGVDAKRLCAPWKRTVGFAVVKLGLAIACLFFLNSVQVVTYLYCFGLIYSAVQKFVNAFRKTAIVYVQ